ncbi:MAG: permease-like cell division protein FtsX [Pseudomonadota bacterium]|nr:permease-like cell division protein FtsX [Pseudomonadota bacterium]
MTSRAWLSRHAQILVGSLGRIAQHPVGAGMTMAVIAVALALPLLFQIFLLNAAAVTADWQQAFDISVYLKTGGDSRGVAVAKTLRARPDVSAVRLVTAEQALVEFRENSGFGSALDALKDNPLPALLVVTPASADRTVAGTSRLRQAIGSLPDVQSMQIDTQWVGRLTAILAVLERLARLTGGLLGAAVLLVVGNTIRLDILNRRSEIEVMKLVGATDGFARRPFLYAGLWYGLGGGVLALMLIGVGVSVLAGPVGALAAEYGARLTLRGLSVPRGLEVLAAAMFLGWLGSWIAATWHIRAIDPV